MSVTARAATRLAKELLSDSEDGHGRTSDRARELVCRATNSIV